MTYLFSNTSSIFQSNGTAITEVNPLPVTTGSSVTNILGNVLVNGFPDSSISAFNELLVSEMYPEIQLDAVFGLQDIATYIRLIGDGTAGANTEISTFYANSSTTTGSSGQIASARYMRYRPGQGALARFTAAFTMSNSSAGITNAIQRAGLFHIGEAYQFGLSGESTSANAGIGILRSYGGKPEIRTLTITTAPTGSQTANIVLDDVSYTVAIASGTAANTAAQIAKGNVYGNVWFTDQVGSTITFMRTAAGPHAGSYSFSSTGTGTLATGTFTQNTAGINSTNVWTYKANWNGTPITFDPSKLNVYSIDFRWLGAGIVRFFMEDPITGKMVLVHTQHYANTATVPHVYNPTFRLGWVSAAYNGGPAIPAVVTGASAMASIEGPATQNIFSKSWYELNSGTRAQNVLHHLLSIRNPRVRSGKENTTTLIMQQLSVALQCTDPSVVYLFINATPSQNLIFNSISGASVSFSNTACTFSTVTDTPVAVFTVGISGSSQFDLIPFNFGLNPGDVISVGVSSTNAITNSAVALVWQRE